MSILRASIRWLNKCDTMHWLFFFIPTPATRSLATRCFRQDFNISTNLIHCLPLAAGTATVWETR